MKSNPQVASKAKRVILFECSVATRIVDMCTCCYYTGDSSGVCMHLGGEDLCHCRDAQSVEVPDSCPFCGGKVRVIDDGKKSAYAFVIVCLNSECRYYGVTLAQEKK